ncbi:class I adenylate-forming enzyme family protein [Nannocystis pusilla]|uniref:class I adenylate-forming enzyme family protein n=1 Tax=Nannocystis pusilla TaxID=889268 RepID=UPI003B7C675B
MRAVLGRLDRAAEGVVLGHRHFLAIARSLSQVIGMGPEHRDLILSPMTHSGGWQRVTSTLLRGGTVVIFEGMFSVAALVDDVEEFGITGFFTTPPVLRTLLRVDPGKFAGKAETLRSIEIASAPVTAAELAQLGALFPKIDIYLQYGLTECSRALILDARKYPHKLHTVGLPTAGVEVAICGEDGRALPPGQEGEILLRAPQRTDHYWNLPDLNASRFRDGWLLTGDFGVRDEEGFVVYRGRRDDMINCGGMSYFPAEVELLLGAVPGVKDALVAGVPDPQRLLTDVPWIFVVPHNPETWSVREFTAHARAPAGAHGAAQCGDRAGDPADAVGQAGPARDGPPPRARTGRGAVTEAEIAKTIHAYFTASYPHLGRTLEYDTDLLNEWFVDSLGIVQTVQFWRTRSGSTWPARTSRSTISQCAGAGGLRAPQAGVSADGRGAPPRQQAGARGPARA